MVTVAIPISVSAILVGNFAIRRVGRDAISVHQILHTALKTNDVIAIIRLTCLDPP